MNLDGDPFLERNIFLVQNTQQHQQSTSTITGFNSVLFEDQSIMRFLDNDISSTFEFAEFGENFQKPKDHPLTKETNEAHQNLSHLESILKSKKPLT
jgi:hypothetical protein